MFRRPLTALFSATNNNSSVSSDTKLLNLYDFDSVVVKLITPILTGAGAKVSYFIQTTDDEGTTWYDCAAAGVSSANTSATAQWLVIPVSGKNSQAISSANASSLTSSTSGVAISGLPLLSPLVRVAYGFGGTITTIQTNVIFYANGQDRAN